MALRPGRALSALTFRGRCVIGGGCVLLLAGMVLGEQALTQLAAFVLALPILAALVVARQRFRLGTRRTVTPGRLPRGTSAQVTLAVTNADSRTGGLWLLDEQLSADLGVSPRFVVDRLPAGATTTLTYPVRGQRRGRHLLGPLTMRLVDPFGLVERSTAGAGSAALLVVPRVLPLGAGGPSSGQGGGGEGARRSLAVHGEDDVSSREYRYGDDLRKVHWRATARTGELMVRLEERPWQAQATLFLDTRSRGHLLAGRDTAGRPPLPGDECPPPDSLEWLIEAAATIGTALTRRGAALRVLTDAGDLAPSSGGHRLGPEELLDRLATVSPSRQPDLSGAAAHLVRTAGEGPLLCLLGAVDPGQVVELIRARTGPVTDLAVLLDIGSWVPADGGRRSRTLTSASRETLLRQREDTAELLHAAGWRVALADADRSVPEVWAALGAPGAGSPGAARTGLPT